MKPKTLKALGEALVLDNAIIQAVTVNKENVELETVLIASLMSHVAVIAALIESDTEQATADLWKWSAREWNNS